VRQKCAELIAKLQQDKLTGPKIRLILNRFLPPLFMDAMKDNPEAAIITFEGTYENPELIWNEEARQRVCEALRKMSDSLYKRQSAPNGADEKWTILEDLREAGVQNVTEPTATLYSSVSSQHELVVSGVFIRLFITNPGWVLRKPKEFLVDLFELWLDLTNRKMQDGEHLELSTQALVQLFIAQPVLLDNLTSMGVLPQVIQVLESKKDSIVGAGLNVFHQVVNSENCLKSMSAYEVMGPIKQAMLTRRDLVHLSAEALAKLFSTQSVVDEFVGQVIQFSILFSLCSIFLDHLLFISETLKALKCNLIEEMLKLLETNLERVEKPASVKAQLVNAIKAMLNSVQHLTQVS
jgi:DnaJ family protein C protein 13